MDVLNEVKWLKNCEVNKEIPIDKFVFNNMINDNDAIILDESCDKIISRYKIDKRILSNYIDNADELYQEIHIIEVEVKTYKAFYDVNYIISKAVLYPLILVIKQKGKYKIVISRTSINKKNHNKNKVEKPMFTAYMFDDKDTYIKEKLINEFNGIDFEKINNIYELHDVIYAIISKYHNRLIPMNKYLGYVELYERNPNMPKPEKKMREECTIYRINLLDDSKTYTRNRMKKYSKSEREKDKHRYMAIDSEEFFYFIYPYYEKSFKSKNINNIDDLNRDLFDTNMYSFEDEDRKKKELIEHGFESYEEKNEVEIGNIVTLKGLSEVKSFIIKELPDGTLPLVPKMLVGKRLGDYIEYKQKKYEIIKIVKDNYGEKND